MTEENEDQRRSRPQRLAESMPHGVGSDIAQLIASYIHNEVQLAIQVIEWAIDNRDEYINCDPDEAEQGRLDMENIVALANKIVKSEDQS